MVFACIIAWAKSDYLPTVTHAGKQCYYYTVTKGETVYGITHRFGWDEEVFMQYNPQAANLKAGNVVYYPCPKQEAKSEAEQKAAKVDRSLSYDYKKTVNANENIKSASTDTLRAKIEPIIYNVNSGETLYSIAQANNTTISRILRDNPGLKPTGLQAGQRLRLFPGSVKEHIETRTVTEKKRNGEAQYKATNDDNFTTIAARFNITEQQLREANPKLKEVKKGKKLTVPLFTDTLVSKPVLVLDARENTAAGLQQIYAEQRGLIPAGEPLDITLVVNTANGEKRRDVEFMKGFMLGLESLKKTAGKVTVHVKEVKNLNELKSLLANPTTAKTDLLLTSFDKDTPTIVQDFAKNSGVPTVNVFDAKTDFSALGPNGIQLLPPSDYFFDRASEYLTLVMPDRRFIFVGEALNDADESMSASVLSRLKDSNAQNVVQLADNAALAAYRFNPALSYTIISDAGTKDEVKAVLDVIDDVIERYPGLPLSLVGRPTWVVYAPNMEERFQKVDTYIPSRFVPASVNGASKDYEKLHSKTYGTAPLHTLPAYSAMGYDTARYLISTMSKARGDLNEAVQGQGAVQLDFRLERPELWSGLMNRSVYLLHYTPFMTTDKIQL